MTRTFDSSVSTIEGQVGMIGVNVPVPFYSFVGWESSLFGGSHAHGSEGAHLCIRSHAGPTADSRRTPEPPSAENKGVLP